MGKKKAEEQKKEGQEEKKEVNEEIVLKVDMHCEGCARRVQKSLRRFEGVADVKTDCKSHMVVVKGKAADPVKVCERIQRKTGRKTEIISPLPKPEKEEKKEDDKADNVEEIKKEELPPVITAILKVRMHCEACAQVLQKRIRKMDGVESVEADLNNDQVIVKGVVDPQQLVQKVYKRTGKVASLVQEEEKKEEKKDEEGEEKKDEEGEEKKDEKEGGENNKEGEAAKEEENREDNVKKMEYWPAKYYVEYIYPPEIFSDENPHACSIM